MREFLEDAESHRDDGYGRAQHLNKVELPKRFYKAVGVGSAPGGFAVTLDGKTPRTPAQKPVVVPYPALAEVMAEEWAAQGEFIDPRTMPVVRLVNSAIEAGEERHEALRAEIVKYAGNDLLLYRADHPRELVAEQERVWDAALVALARHFEVAFQPTIGILHQPQPAPTLERLAASLSDTTLFEAVTLNSLTGLTGSGLLAIALRENLMDAEAVWTAAHVDEDHNIRLWGEVHEATERREKRRMEFDAAVKVLEIVRG
ncbi:ATP12 family protein [Devosia sp.]|uniref:ATP12 family chaperone protein n=1 Tax=Devosia sp. TaxID=1871048 RepID=UPI001AC6598D|nr:ATP12 family protein [Devosia sp.]MBN9308454.1 ATPase [Devosia sp.]